MKNQIHGTVVPITGKITLRDFLFCSIFISLAFIITSCQKEVLTPAGNSHLPSVTATDPAYNEADVDIQKTITASFDMDLDPSKFLVNFTVQKDTVFIPGTISIAGKKATFMPDDPLDMDTDYIIAIDVTDNLPVARAAEKHYMSIFHTKQ
jgi:hypothetical protein